MELVITQPNVEIREYVLNGIHYREEIIPTLWTEVISYTPCHTVTPYDYYGNKWCRQTVAALSLGGIVGFSIETKKHIVNPIGSGPGGMRRLGDDMVPSDYRVICFKYDFEKAEQILNEFDEDVEKWLHHGGQMPIPLK